MKIAARAIEGFLRQPPAETLAVLVYGPDEGLVRERLRILTATVLQDINDPFNSVEINGEILGQDHGRLVDEVRSISMLGGRRVIRVRGGDERTVTAAVQSTLTALRPGDNLLLIEGGDLGPRSALRLLFEAAENAAALPCYVGEERDIARVISESLRGMGYRMSPDALNLMSASVVGDQALVRNEIEKLITYMGAMKEVDIPDVEACVALAAALSLDDMPRHVGGGRFAEAERILSFVLSEGTPPVVILRALQNYFLRLHGMKARVSSGESVEAVLSSVRPPIFFRHKPDFQAQIQKLSISQIEQALLIIVSAEARCKQSNSMPDLVIQRAILSLCQSLGRRAA